MDERVGNHAVGDVLLDGSKIAEVAARIDAPDAAVIDASGHIVMPGFIDAHSHQFETVLRSFLADGILINDGRPEAHTIIMNRFCRSFRWVIARRTSTSTSFSQGSHRSTPA
jgi:cytosine/adenosine deaminase-related metal-dependent hydrolase